MKLTLKLKSWHSLMVAVVMLLAVGCSASASVVDEEVGAEASTTVTPVAAEPTATVIVVQSTLPAAPTATPQPAPTSGPTPVSTPTAVPTAITPEVTPTTASLVEAVVTDVVDGDTIDVLIDGQEYRVRYIGIDTPETVHPIRGEEPYGREASEHNKALVEGQTVLLEKDVSDTDQYGRLLRYVRLGDGTMVNALLVAGGYAQVSTFPPEVKYTDDFLELERMAREGGVGLWALTTEPAQGETPEPV
jgi:micrococcal nuclease